MEVADIKGVAGRQARKAQNRPLSKRRNQSIHRPTAGLTNPPRAPTSQTPHASPTPHASHRSGFAFSLAAATAQPPAQFPANHAQGVCPDTLLKLTFPTLRPSASPAKFAFMTPRTTIGWTPWTSPYRPTRPVPKRPTAAARPPRKSPRQPARKATPSVAPRVSISTPSSSTATSPSSTRTTTFSIITDYYVQMDPGVLFDRTIPLRAITAPPTGFFPPRTPRPPRISSRLVIAADGSGDFATVQAHSISSRQKPPSRDFSTPPGNYTEIVTSRTSPTSPSSGGPATNPRHRLRRTNNQLQHPAEHQREPSGAN